ncbi:MAG: hypothetical protein WAL52_07545 [Candidatus Sulfotelmatobacter sp.]
MFCARYYIIEIVDGPSRRAQRNPALCAIRRWGKIREYGPGKNRPGTKFVTHHPGSVMIKASLPATL